MKKTIFLAVTVLTIFICITFAFALNCGGGYFDYDEDPGSWIPLDDVRGYTTTIGYAHGGEYWNSMYAYVQVSSGGDMRDGQNSGIHVSQAGTGRVKLPGYDHGTVIHYGWVNCNYPYEGGCDGQNDLNIEVDV